MTIARMLVRLDADDKRVIRVFDNAQRKVELFAEAAMRMGRALTIGLTLPIGLAARSVTQAAIEMDALRLGLDAMTGSAAETQAQLERLTEVAKQPGIGFREAIQGSIQLQAVGFAAKDAERALSAFGNAIALTGGGSAQLERVLYQFTQMAAAGKVLGQDLRPMIQQAPAIAKALNEVFGTVQAGKIAEQTKDFKTFFNILIPALEKMPTVGGSARTAMENMTDALFRMRAEIGEKLLPALLPLAEGIAKFADNMSRVEPATVRSGIALAVVLAVLGPLAIGLSVATSAAVALGTALRLSLLPFLGTGAVIAVGVGWLAKKMIEFKLETLSADDAARKFSRSLDNMSQSVSGLSEATARLEHNRVSAALSEAMAERAKTPKQFQSDQGDAGLLMIDNPEWKRLDDAVKELSTRYRVLTSHIGDIVFDRGGESTFTPTGDKTPLEIATEQANLLAQALEILPKNTDLWHEAQRRAIAAMKQANTLAGQQADALGEVSIGYRSLVRDLEGVLGFSLSSLSAKVPDISPKIVTQPFGLGQGGEVERIENTVRPFIERAKESALALHEHLMATNAVYAAQWVTADEMQRFNYQLQVSREQLKAQFTNPRQTGQQALGMLGEAALGVAQQLSPLGMVAYFLNTVMEELAPAIEAFLSPIAILAKALMPAFLAIMEALFPVMKIVTIAATYVGQVFFAVAGGIYKVLGGLLTSVGDLLNKLPGSIGNPLKRLGETYTNLGKGFAETADNLGKARDDIKNLEWNDAVTEATEGMKKLTDATLGAVQGFKTAGLRHLATLPSPYSPATGGGGGNGGRTAQPRDRPQPTVVQGATFAPVINIQGGSDGAETYRNFYYDLGNRVRDRGPTDPALLLWESLPEPN